jgi:hypothetical protein
MLEVPGTHQWWETTMLASFAMALRRLFAFLPIVMVLSLSLFMGAVRVRGGKGPDRLSILGLFSAAGIVIALATRAKYGGYENAYIPAYFLVILAGITAYGVVAKRLSGWGEEGDGGGRRSVAMVVSILFFGGVLVSAGVHAIGIDVRGQRVTDGRRVAAGQLAALVEGVGGRVLVPSRNAAALTRDPAHNHYHNMAAGDLAGYPRLFEQFQEDNERGFREGRFRAVLMDVPVESLAQRFGYRRMSLDELGIESELLSSMTGKPTCPRYIYVLPGVDPARLRQAVREASS